jgi:hypothetical protein
VPGIVIFFQLIFLNIAEISKFSLLKEIEFYGKHGKSKFITRKREFNSIDGQLNYFSKKA